MRYGARMRHGGKRAAVAPLYMLLDGVAVQRPLPQELVGQEPAPSGSLILTFAWTVICLRSTHRRTIVFTAWLGSAHQPAVAIAMPMRRKSTRTADSTVSTECHTPSLNLPRGRQDRVAAPRLRRRACYAAG
jgi:hypothetical protein